LLLQYARGQGQFFGGSDLNGNDSIDESERGVYTYSGTPGAVSRGASDLLMNQGAWNWSRPYTDFATQIEINKTAELESSTHNITFGAFLSRTNVQQREIYSSTLVEFADQPRFLDAIVEGAGPDGTFDTADDTNLGPDGTFGTEDDVRFNPATDRRITRDGLSNAATQYVNNNISSNKIAGFIGDEIEFDRLRIDLGARFGVRKAEWSVEGSEAISTGDELAVQNFQ